MRPLNQILLRHVLMLMGLGLVLGSLLLGTSSSLAAPTATESVQRTIGEVIRVLEDKELKKPDRAEERRRELEKVIGDRFSYEEMAKRALAAQWTKLNDKQRQEFVELFQRLLS